MGNNTRVNSDYPIGDKQLVDTIVDKYNKVLSATGGNLPMFDATTGELIDSGFRASDVGLGAGTNDHSVLVNRDALDAHSITSITGLQPALDGKTESADFIDTSAGLPDAGKPVKTNINGFIDDTLISIQAIQLRGDFTPEAAQEYPSSFSLNWAWYIKGGDYTWTTGDLAGKTYTDNDLLIYTTSGWIVNAASTLDTNYYTKAEADALLALKLDVNGTAADSVLFGGNTPAHYATQSSLDITNGNVTSNTSALSNKADINGNTGQVFSASDPVNPQHVVTKSYLEGFSVPGTGDMTQAVYDTNSNGIVDNSELVNGLTVETAVPAGAEFTDTVFTLAQAHATALSF